MSVDAPTKTKLALDLSPESYFFELVQNSISAKKIRVQPETEFYLVRLLNRFISSESLYTKTNNGNLEDQPLALLYKEALETEVSSAQKMLFQNIGDISLYKAGFFQEALTQNVDLDYYVGMGGLAYQGAAERTEEKHFRSIFTELSKKFTHLVDVLFDVSEQTLTTKTEQDLLRLYEMWSRTGSERARRALIRAGIQLDKGSK